MRRPRETRRKGRELAVGELLQRYLEHHPAFAANPLGNWQDLVGEQVARYSQPKALKDKVLTLVAYDSIWKHHLDLNSQALVQKINGDRPEPLVVKIVVRVGEVPESMPVLNPNHKLLQKMGSKRRSAKKKKKPPVRPLTAQEKTLLKTLPDKDLRAIGSRLLRRLPDDEPEE